MREGMLLFSAPSPSLSPGPENVLSAHCPDSLYTGKNDVQEQHAILTDTKALGTTRKSSVRWPPSHQDI